jgi:hypothetical protein
MFGDGRPDALGRARDDGDFAGESFGVGCAHSFYFLFV